MREFDFSQLQSVTTPQDWIDNAVMIPQKQPEPKRRLYRFRLAAIGAAASVAVVTAAVLTLTLHAGKPVPPLQAIPAVPVATAAAATDGTGSVQEQPSTERNTETPPTASTATTVPQTSGRAVQPQPTKPAAVSSSAVTAPPATAATKATSPVTKPVPTQPATRPAATTVPATVPSTAAATEVLIEVGTESGEQPASQATTVTAQEPVLFDGLLALRITPACPLFDSATVSLTFYEDGVPSADTAVTEPKLSKGGYKAVVFYPQDKNILLYRWHTYTLRIEDTDGNAVTAEVFVRSGNALTVTV